MGVFTDENLNWKIHIDKVCLKISELNGILYKIRHKLTTESMISIYHTLCYPHLTYCVPIWASTWPSFTKKLSIAQNKIFRCIFFMQKFESTNQVFIDKNILKFPYIHKYFTLLMIFKSQGKNSIFNIINNNINTRNNNINLVCPTFRTVSYSNSVISLGPKMFNSLPLDKKLLLTTANISRYKQEIKKILLLQQNM